MPHATPAELFDWHARPGAFRRLNAPWDPVTVVERQGDGLDVGTRLRLRARVGPVSVSWTAEHTACEPPHGFTDEQRGGPFTRWIHQHRFLDDPGGAVLEDEIDWAAPLGALGAAVGGVPSRLERVFRFRHRRTVDDLARHGPYRDRPRLRVAISGATGLIGSALSAFLDAGGHEVVPIVRSPDRPGIVADFDARTLDPAQLEGIDAVVHLAGAPISEGRWTEANRARIRDSRVNGTATIAAALASMDRPPPVWVCGSAVGYYGAAGDTVCDEDAPSGDTFLAEVAREWEAASEPARAAGVRVVTLRTGLVLSAGGGLLASLLPMFRAAAGGPLGSGRQYMPWIHLDDAIGMVHEALLDDRYEGPLNMTAPEPVPNRAFAKALGRAVSRPALVPAPAAAVSLAMGADKAREIALTGQRAVPARAEALGFRFVHPELEAALRFELGVG